MMLRTENGYLDFNDIVEIERQALLFEELSETRGDFSYSFTIQATHNNLFLLGLPFPDNASKLVYQKINADLISDSGHLVRTGFIRVEVLDYIEGITCSFFSGNSNWMALLTGDMTELNLSSYDRDMTASEIGDSFLETEGIVFPVIDTGALIMRSYPNLAIEDFVGCFYLHTLFKEVFKQSGLKLSGELLNDPLFNMIVVATNTRSKIDVDNNTIFAGKNDNQVIPTGLSVQDITFNLHSQPYFTGSDVTFNSDIEYVASSDMLVDISFTYVATIYIIVQIKRNGSNLFPEFPNATTANDQSTAYANSVLLRAGDVIKITAFNDQASPSTITKATLRITPKFIYKAFGRSCVPLWTKLEFVSNVLSIFNTVTDYDPYSKTVTINLFNRVKTKTPIDLSSYVQVTQVDYIDFISNYGQNTLLTYETSEDDSLQEYNISSFLNYGAGVIEVNNEFLNKTESLLDSDFAAPISYYNSVFDASLEKINFVQLDDLASTDISSTSSASGEPRFNIDDEIFNTYDVVRIESTEPTYNGIYTVFSTGSGWVQVQGLLYNGAATGTITKLKHEVTTDDSVYLFVKTKRYNAVDFTITDRTWYFNTLAEDDWALAYFSLLNNGTQINEDYKQSLSFGTITDPSFYQRTIIQTYWGTASSVLNDPVKLFVTAYLPETVYKSLTSLTPVYIKTKETVNLYYLNRDTGYVDQATPCILELIKLP